MKKASLFRKLLLGFLLVAILPVLGLGVYSFVLERNDSIEREIRRLQSGAARLANEIETYVAVNQNLVRYLAVTSEVMDFASRKNHTAEEVEKFGKWLETQRALSPDYGAVYTMDLSGLCTGSSRSDFLGGNFGFREYFKEAAKGNFHKSDWAIGAVSRDPGMYVSAPIINGGEIIGVIAIKVYVQKIQAAVEREARADRRAFLLNPRGISLSHTQKEFVYTSILPLTGEDFSEIEKSRQFTGIKITLADASEELCKGFKAAFYENTPQTLSYTVGGEPRYGTLLKVKDLPWVVGISIREEQLFARSHRLMLNTILVALIALGAAVIASYFLTERFTARIIGLSEAMGGFGAGDLSRRAASGPNDEIGSLATTFNEMAETIAEHTETLEERVAERTSELSEANRKNLEVIEELKQALQEVKTLKGMLPICASCKKIRNDEGYWTQIEAFILCHTEAELSHGMCPDCAERLYPEYFKDEEE